MEDLIGINVNDDEKELDVMESIITITFFNNSYLDEDGNRFIKREELIPFVKTLAAKIKNLEL